MKIIGFIILFPILILFYSCGDPNPQQTDNITSLDEFRIKVIKKTTIDDSIPNGVSREFEEVYVYNPFEKEKFKRVLLYNFNGERLKEIKFKRGSEQSPDSFSGVAYIDRVKNRYFVLDHISKIVIFNQNFTRINTLMFYISRLFVDFFHLEKDLCLISKKIYSGKKIICPVDLYELGENKVTKLYNIHKFKMKYPFYEHKYPPSYRKKFFPIEFMWDTPYGFYKDNKIYLSISSENKLFIYDLQKKEKKVVVLNFLKGTNYTKEVVQKMGQYFRSDESNKRWSNLKYLKNEYIPFGEKIYHLGMYDVGKNIIGFIGKINHHTMEMRLDVFNTNDLKYEKSIWFPIVNSILWSWAQFKRLGYFTFFDIDKHIFINFDSKTVGDYEPYVNIMRFELIKQKKVRNLAQ